MQPELRQEVMLTLLSQLTDINLGLYPGPSTYSTLPSYIPYITVTSMQHEAVVISEILYLARWYRLPSHPRPAPGATMNRMISRGCTLAMTVQSVRGRRCLISEAATVAAGRVHFKRTLSAVHYSQQNMLSCPADLPDHADLLSTVATVWRTSTAHVAGPTTAASTYYGVQRSTIQ